MPHGHGHEDHDRHEADWGAIGALLENEAEMSRGVLEGAAQWLAGLARPVRRVLDLGSGPGVATGVLAAAFPDAEVLAVDGSAPLLERAAARAARLGLAERVAVALCDLPDGVDALDAADLVWAARVVHHLGDQREAVRRMATLVRPGGVLAIAEGGLAQRVLPRDIGFGRPGLEARLDVATHDWFAEMRADQAGSVATVEDWPGILADAGLTPLGTHSFLVDHPAPLDAVTRAVVVGSWGSIRERLADLISDDDRATLDRLLDPDDEGGLYRRRDLFVLGASTVHAARAARE